jgi:prepilin-type N-terminal cleavage/methylation domain-containing protein
LPAAGQPFLIGYLLMKKTSCKNQKGFSLAEAMMATVVLGIAAAGVLLPFTSGAAVRAEGMRRTLAAKLASDLMEQFIDTSFEELVANGGGYIDELQGQIKDVNGVLFSDPAYANFSRGASYEYDASQPFFIIVTVWVKYNGNEIVSLSRLISE